MTNARSFFSCLGVLVLAAVTAASAQAPRTSTPAANPANRDVAAARISAHLAAGRFDQALATYDAFVTATRKPDGSLLGDIARADLSRIERANAGTPVAFAALERLARGGNAAALESLKRAAATASWSARESVPPVVSLARLGDKDAIATLGRWLDTSAVDQQGLVIRDVQEAGVRSLAPKIAARLGDPQIDVRSAAALALGRLEYAAGVPRLRELFQTDVAVVRMFAGAALKRLGQADADTYLAQLLKSDVPEVRLIAAEGYRSATTKEWIPAVRQLLTDRNEVSRLKAAELLACCDETDARAALLSALASENPSMRAEAARILEETGLADLALARRLMGDAADTVRVYGDGVLLHQK